MEFASILSTSVGSRFISSLAKSLKVFLPVVILPPANTLHIEARFFGSSPFSSPCPPPSVDKAPNFFILRASSARASSFSSFSASTLAASAFSLSFSSLRLPLREPDLSEFGERRLELERLRKAFAAAAPFAEGLRELDALLGLRPRVAPLPFLGFSAPSMFPPGVVSAALAARLSSTSLSCSLNFPVDDAPFLTLVAAMIFTCTLLLAQLFLKLCPRSDLSSGGDTLKLWPVDEAVACWAPSAAEAETETAGVWWLLPFFPSHRSRTERSSEEEEDNLPPAAAFPPFSPPPPIPIPPAAALYFLDPPLESQGDGERPPPPPFSLAPLL